MSKQQEKSKMLPTEQVVTPPVPTEADMKIIRAVKPEDLPWLPPPPAKQNKFLMKMKENPFVPIGV